MALVVKDRVKETSTSTGTGTINLAGAVGGFQTFVAGVGTGNTTYYAIEDANGTAWEVGLGTVTDASPDTLARTTILASSTGSAISLSSGSHTVFGTYPAGKAAYLDADGLTSFSLNDLPDVKFFDGVEFSRSFLINNSGSTQTGTLDDANNNVGIGYQALSSITSAAKSIAFGYYALKELTTGSSNIAMGLESQRYANDGFSNIAIGQYSLRGNSDGTSTTGNSYNIAIGDNTARDITTGDSNIAMGTFALDKVTTGSHNIGLGDYALQRVLDGSYNTAVGRNALQGTASSIGQSYNTAIGAAAGYGLTTGDKNIFIGYTAGYEHTSDDSMLYIANNQESADGTFIKGDMANKHLAIGMADDLFTNSAGDPTLQVYPKDAADDAIYAKMPSSHTGDLIRIENSSGTSLLTIDKDGLKLDNLVDISYGGTNLTRTLLINNTPGSASTHGTLGSDNSDNIGIGYQALSNITGATYSVAIGSSAQRYATNGASNIAIGSGAMRGNDDGTSTTGNQHNVAIGNSAVRYITTGDYNVGIGSHSCSATDGSGNIGIGYGALNKDGGATGSSYNIGIGYYAGHNLTSGDYNILIGYYTGTGLTTEDNTLLIGNQTMENDGTLIKGDMSSKWLAVGAADVTLSTADATLQIFPNNINDTVLYAKHTGTHTGDLILMENSSGTDLFKVDKDGNITAGTVTVTTSPVVPYATITGDTTVTTAHVVVFANATSGEIDVTLYAATSNGGRTLTIKKTDSSANAVVITRAGSETIDGQTSVTLIHQNEAVTLVSDNSNWFIV